eukprot:TRINITY_DN32130_c0_g1_i1.p1 TRINITY_DN32130_c0_g1~~TRINITY_DN32130_c0_g1_i1.p1  ORF type:complete len:296 (-),score=94.84 TRINITY_DN32130_c0_g1_i1:205-1092(-)
MGRVSRYKKVKKDPFQRKARPSEEVKIDFSKEENLKVPIKLRMLQNSIKRLEDHTARVKEHRKRKKDEADGKTPDAATASQESTPSADSKGTAGGLIKMPTQGADESFQQFSRRLSNATREALRAQKLQPKKASADRRKQYLKEKKLKKKGKLQTADEEQRQQQEPERDFDQFKDTIEFGEEVDRPPTITARPRQRKIPGALPADKPTSGIAGKSFLFLKKLKGEEVPEPEEADDQDSGPKLKHKNKKPRMPSVEEQTAADEREAMRNEAVQRYKAHKKQQRINRKAEGGNAFYL